MKKDSGGFMLKHFEKLALGAFGLIVVVFLIFATVLGSYYDKDADQLQAQLKQKQDMIAATQPANFAGLAGVEVTDYHSLLDKTDVDRGTGEQLAVIGTVGPRLSKRPTPELFPMTDLRAIAVREILATNYLVGDDPDKRNGGGSGDNLPGVGGTGSGGGSSAGQGLNDGDEGGTGIGGNLGGGNSNNNNSGGDNKAEAPKPTGYQPPDKDSQASVVSFVILTGTVPNAQQTREFQEKTRNTLGGGMTYPQYVSVQMERRSRVDDQIDVDWSASPLDFETVKQIVEDINRNWVSSNVEEIVPEQNVFPMSADTTDSRGNKVPYIGFTMFPAPAIGRVWNDALTTQSIATIESGPALIPLNEILGDWQVEGRTDATFLANQGAYKGEPAAVVPARKKFTVALGQNADQIVLSTPGTENLFDATAFEVIADGAEKNAKVFNPKIGELRRFGDVIVKRSDSWYELYRKPSDDKLTRIVVLYLDGNDMASQAVAFEQTFERYRASQGFGSTSSSQDNAAGANKAMEQQVVQGPPNYLFRFYDPSVEKGREYQYRVRFIIENPNWKLNPGYLANPEDADQQYLYTDWSDPTDWVAVASYADTVIGPAKLAGNGRTISFFLREPSSQDTPIRNADKVVAMLLAQVDAKPGQLLNFSVDNPVPIDVVKGAPAPVELPDRARKFTHVYRTDELVLDVHGGDRYGKLTTQGEALMVDASGNLVVRSEADSSYASVNYNYELSDQNKRQSRADDKDKDNKNNQGQGIGGDDGGRR